VRGAAQALAQEARARLDGEPGAPGGGSAGGGGAGNRMRIRAHALASRCRPRAWRGACFASASMLRTLVRRLPAPVQNLASSVLAMLFALLWVGLGLRLVTLSSDPRVLVYPRVADGINGFEDPEFRHEVPSGQFRVLGLGASNLVTGGFQPEFQRRLDAAPLFRKHDLSVRFVSSGVPAQMSFDSLWKYEYWYRGYDFDLVVYYNGINDARANNYPREVFREDYTQFPYYRRFAPVFEWVERHPTLSGYFGVTLGVTLAHRLTVQLEPAFRREAPYNSPLEDPWLVEGADVKTGRVFERNAEEVLRVARERGQKVLLLTFAYYLPDDYSNERFFAHETDYSFSEDSVATEVWGLPENVAAAIEAHNEAIRRVARHHPDALFYDMARAIPKDREHFIDICHWTERGRRVFARGVLEALAAHEQALLAPALARRS